MESKQSKNTESQIDKFERFSTGEYIEVTCGGKMVAEFEYSNDHGLFFGVDYTEDFEDFVNQCITDLEDGFRIDDAFTPTSLLNLLEELKAEIPELAIYGRTLLEKRIEEGTL